MEPCKKHWDGYTSFSYLVDGEDYVPFEMAPQIGRVAPTIVPLEAAQEERAEQFVDQLVCISLHEHGGIAPVDWDDNDAYVRQGREWYGYEGLAPASGLDAVFENFFDGTATITSMGGWKWDRRGLRPRHAPCRPRAPDHDVPGGRAWPTSSERTPSDASP